MITVRRHHLVKLAALLALAAPGAIHAATFDFHIDLNVASLASAANGPFFLDFQLNKGSGLDNSVSITNFTFTGGSFTGTAQGNGSGDLGSTVTLAENSTDHAFNEFFQGFSTSTTTIGFDVSITQNTTALTPDGFVVDILDSEVGNFPIYTGADDTVGLVELSITGHNTIGDVATYSSTDPAGVTASVHAIPEPGTAFLCVAGAGLALFRRHRATRSLKA